MIGVLRILLWTLVLSGVANAGCGFDSPSLPEPIQPIVEVHATNAPFCPPLAPPGSEQRVVRIKSGDVRSLLRAVRRSRPDTTLLLDDGVYRLAPRQSITVSTPRLTIRSASGNRDAVRIEGGSITIGINADACQIADLTLSGARFHGIQVRGERGVARTKIYNVRVQDTGQQLIKVSTGDGKSGKFGDEGLVACSLIEYSSYARGTDRTPPRYTNGVDIIAGKGWIIRDNVFRRIRSKAGPAGPAILVWRNATDTVIRRNLIIDSWRGIALGLSPPNARSRGGPDVMYDHRNGLVENNVILALREPADAAIENNFAVGSRVLHNTVYYREGLKHAVHWSIEYRFPPTTVVIKNNLTNFPILKRRPAPRQEAVIEGNEIRAEAHWFRDIMAEDIHLIREAPVIDRGVAVPESPADIDGTTRPMGRAPDVGADEFEG